MEDSKEGNGSIVSLLGVYSYMYLLQSIWLSVGREIADGGQEEYWNLGTMNGGGGGKYPGREK